MPLLRYVAWSRGDYEILFSVIQSYLLFSLVNDDDDDDDDVDDAELLAKAPSGRCIKDICVM